VSDPREELARLIENSPIVSAAGFPTPRMCSAIADAAIAAGWVNLSTLATDPDAVERVEQVLIKHQRRSIESCLCGWAKLGHSHALHQAEAVFAALAASPASEEGQA
jgi:hypothetical protein